MGRNFSPARNVRSITAPSEARRSLERTNAPPLPGLTCWNSRILKTVPSTSMWLPFLNWLVEITPLQASGAGAVAATRSARGRAGGILPARPGRSASADADHPVHPEAVVTVEEAHERVAPGAAEADR